MRHSDEWLGGKPGMNTHARRSAILDAITKAGSVDAYDLAKLFGVSGSTIRRDLHHLGERQLLCRTHGGAVATTVNYDLPIRYRRARKATEKARIGAAVAQLVPPGSVVGLNGGTTTTEVARELAERGQGWHPAFTIVTNAINIPSELTVRRHINLIVTGGVSRPHSFELTGLVAYDAVSRLDLDVTVLGVDALDPDWGAKAADDDEAQINRLMAAKALTVIIAADSSKLSTRGFAWVCPLADVNTLVTDTAAPRAEIEKVQAAGVQVIQV
jgi:DeoR family transcriptional regulator of aga operon